MKNAPCTPLTPEEEASLMGAFSPVLTPPEQEEARRMFTPYVFYESRSDGSRDCYCTSCRNRYNVTKAGHADFFNAKHRAVQRGRLGLAPQERMKANCPECGAVAEILGARKFKNCRSLDAKELVVRLSAFDGWLLVQSGVVIREFSNDGGISESVEFHEFRRFAFKPGRRNEWNLAWEFEHYWSQAGAGDFVRGWHKSKTFRWSQPKSVGEAHYPNMYSAAEYRILNPAAFAQSDMKYCGFFQWHAAEYGMRYEPMTGYYCNLCVYLSEYTRRPQMELLLKMGYRKIISDLILSGQSHADCLNWKAGNPPDFFRMSKADFTAFRKSKCPPDLLPRFGRMFGAGLVASLNEFIEIEALFHGVCFSSFCERCLTANVSMRRGAAYASEQAATSSRKNVTAESAVTTWKDYLDAAKKLDYDLSRKDVSMPKNLRTRHDAATKTLKVEADERARKKYANLYDKWRRQYEYGADGLRVVVPTCAADIVAEGKALRHCVGGYAPRHMEGKVTILFLRKASAPNQSYATIEMSVENAAERLQMIQIHGYRNDSGAASPLETHKAFLDDWLAWVHAGSPRDDDGTPVTLSGGGA